jgi:hypothetical protein
MERQPARFVVEIVSTGGRPARSTAGAVTSAEQLPNLPKGDAVFFVVDTAKAGDVGQEVLDAHPEIRCRGEERFFGAN